MNFVDKVIDDINNGIHLPIVESEYELRRSIESTSIFSKNYNNLVGDDTIDRWHLSYDIGMWFLNYKITLQRGWNINIDLTRDERSRLAAARKQAVLKARKEYLEIKRLAKQYE